MRDSPSPSPSLEEAQMSSNHSSSVSSSPSHTERTAETTRTYLLTFVICPGRVTEISQGMKDALAILIRVRDVSVIFFSFLYFHPRPTGQRTVIKSQCVGTFPWCPGGQRVRCDFSGTQEGEQEEPH